MSFMVIKTGLTGLTIVKTIACPKRADVLIACPPLKGTSAGILAVLRFHISVSISSIT
jgi:hypothetical protein